MASKTAKSIENAKAYILGLEVRTGDADTHGARAFHFADLGGMSLNADEARQFSDCVEQLHSAFRGDGLLDKRSVESWFQEAILTAVNLQKESAGPIERRVGQVLRELERKMSVPASTWEVHVPVDGLSLQGLPISFGKVRFRVGDETYRRKIKREVKQVATISPDSPSVKKNFSEAALTAFDENWQGRPVAHLKVKAITSAAAQAKGLKELQATIDVINFFSDILIDTGNGGRVYLPGDTARGKAFSMACQFSHSGACIGNNLNHYLVGAKSAFLLSKETANKLKKFGFGKASAILKKQDKSEWERRILSALQWAGRATSNQIVNEEISEKTGVRREEAFLLYAVALESLIVEGSEITYKFSTRGAHLMGSSHADRKHIRTRLKSLYNLRSKIVHSGLSEISDKELAEMGMYARTAVFRILKNPKLLNFQKWAEFDDWLENKMLR